MKRIFYAEKTPARNGAISGVRVKFDITERRWKQSDNIQERIAPTDDENQLSKYLRAESSTILSSPNTRCSAYHDDHLNRKVEGSSKVEDKNDDDRKWTRDVILEAEQIIIKSEIDNIEVTDVETFSSCTQPFYSVAEEKERKIDFRNDEANSKKSSILHAERKISRSTTSRSLKPLNNLGSLARIKDKGLPISVKQQQRHEGEHALLRAAKNDSVDQIRKLANHGISTEILDQRGWTPLTIALENENLKSAELLIQLNANVNFVHASGMTILHHITAAGTYKGVKFLLRHGANVNAEDSKGWPPVHYAIKQHHLKCTALLLAAGCHSQTYTEKRINEYEQVVKLATIGKWKYHWQKKLDIDITNEILL